MEFILKFLFWFLIFLVIYIFIGYIIILKLRFLLLKKKFDKINPHKPSVTLLISAHNEEKVIAEKIENSLKIDYENLHIVVSSDGSLDDTVHKAKQYISDKLTVYDYKEKRGKNAAINDSVAKIATDIIIFSDADVMYSPDCVSRLIERFTDGVGCVVGEYKFMNEAGSPIGKGESLYWRYEVLTRELESKTGSLLVASGSVCAIRKELFIKLDTTGVADDFQIPVEIAYQGYAVLYEKKAIAYLKPASQLSDEFRRKVRIINQGLWGYKVLGKRIKGFRLLQFISHKWLRWFLGIWFNIIYFSNLFLLDLTNFLGFYNIVFLIQTLFYVFALIGYLLRDSNSLFKIFYIPMYFCMIGTAGWVALVKYLKGQTFASWDKPESAR